MNVQHFTVNILKQLSNILLALPRKLELKYDTYNLPEGWHLRDGCTEAEATYPEGIERSVGATVGAVKEGGQVGHNAV